MLVWLPEDGSGQPKQVAVDWCHVDVFHFQVLVLWNAS